MFRGPLFYLKQVFLHSGYIPIVQPLRITVLTLSPRWVTFRMMIVQQHPGDSTKWYDRKGRTLTISMIRQWEWIARGGYEVPPARQVAEI